MGDAYHRVGPDTDSGKPVVTGVEDNRPIGTFEGTVQVCSPDGQTARAQVHH